MPLVPVFLRHSGVPVDHPLDAWLGNPAVEAVSVDVFDTLLLRSSRPEWLRFRQLAEWQRRALRQAVGRSGVRLPAARDLFVARLEAAAVAYRTVEPNRGQREGRIQEILRLTCLALGLDPGLVPLLHATELAFERSDLSGNRPLARSLARHRAAGRRILFISDMYLTGDDIRHLIADRLPETVIDAGYVSSDVGLTKHGGGLLFTHVLAAEQLAPRALVHVGDSVHSDVAMAEGHGITALHTPRSVLWQRMRAAQSHAFRRLLGWQGLLP